MFFLWYYMELLKKSLVFFTLDTANAISKNSNNSVAKWDVDFQQILGQLFYMLPKGATKPKFRLRLERLIHISPAPNTNEIVKVCMRGLDWESTNYDLTTKSNVNKTILTTTQFADKKVFNLIKNASFEAPAYPLNTHQTMTVRPLDDWVGQWSGGSAIQVISGESSAWRGTGGMDFPSGTQILAFQINTGWARIIQDIDIPADGKYTLFFSARNRTGAPLSPIKIDIGAINVVTDLLVPNNNTWNNYSYTVRLDKGQETFLLFVGSVNGVNLRTIFIDALALIPEGTMTKDSYKGQTTLFNIDTTQNLKKTIELSLEDIDSDNLTNIVVPNYKATFSAQLI